MDKLLEGQVALVTGGNGGIGKAIAKKFVEHGAKVAIIGTNQEKGQKTVEELTPLGQPGCVAFFGANISETEDVKKVLDHVVEAFGPIQILVNNAGITRDGLLMRMSEEDWDRVLDVNLKSCYNTSRPIIRTMMKARSGRIINISSVNGLTGNTGQVNYSASKAGMIGFSKALAKELAGRGVCVNCIAPGFIETDMTSELPEKARANILEMIPLGKMGSPEDIANAALFLASPMGQYITGQVLTVDGGMVM